MWAGQEEPNTGAPNASASATSSALASEANTSSPRDKGEAAGRHGGQRVEQARYGGALDPGPLAGSGRRHALHDVDGQGQEHGAGRGGGAVLEGAAQQYRDLLGMLHLARPLHHRPGNAEQVTMQQRVGVAVPGVLLARRDDQRRAGCPGVEDRLHGMAQPAGRVQVDKARTPGRLRVAVRHGDDAGFVQAQHVGQVERPGQRVHQRQFGRAGIAEHILDALAPQHLQ